jgi:hypothetical protein
MKIKIVGLDHGGEYYCKNTPYGQVPRLFVRFLQISVIVSQYSMLGDPQ